MFSTALCDRLNLIPGGAFEVQDGCQMEDGSAGAI